MRFGQYITGPEDNGDLYNFSPYSKKNNIERELKLENCMICNTPASIFHYHHLRDKWKEMSSLWGYSYGMILSELIKCLPICGTCHTKINRKCYPELKDEVVHSLYLDFWKNNISSFFDTMFHYYTDYQQSFFKAKILQKWPIQFIKKIYSEPNSILWLKEMYQEENPLQYLIDVEIPKVCLKFHTPELQQMNLELRSYC